MKIRDRHCFTQPKPRRIQELILRVIKWGKVLPVTAEQTKKTSLPESAGAENRWAFWKRAAIIALALFGIINAALFQLDNVKRSSPTNLWHGTGSIDLAVNEFNAFTHKPTVVLLGSSLMMFPFWSLDKAQDPAHVGDIFHHHGSAALEDALKKAGFVDPHVFSFAIFGQMVSDAFIYVNEYLAASKTPEYLVYGIAPRDFSDSDLSSPMATNTFKRLVNLNNLGPYASLYLPGLNDKLDFVMAHLCYFYSHRWRLQQDFGKFVERIYIQAGVHEPEKKLDFSNAGFMMFGGFNERWESSEKEYTRRYKNIDQRDLSVQMGFLKRLLQISRERGIKVVVVNMPLSEINRKLLPAGFYQKFRTDVGKIAAQEKGVRYLDIGDTSDFTRWDYWDTAHLGPSGGEKVMAHLVPVLREMQSKK